jgi:glycosyltransferase involved in cell wall biosynthesis
VTRRAVLEVLGRSAGGIARHVAQIASALGDGLRVDVAGPPGLPVAMPQPLLRVTIPNGPFGHSVAVRALTGHLERGHYDVVHAHGLRAGIDAARAAQRARVPTLVTVHNVARPEVAGALRARVYALAEPLVVRRATHVFAVSEDIARTLRAAAPRDAHKVEVLHLGIEPPPRLRLGATEARRRLGIGPGGRLVVTAARLNRQKSLHVLLQAAALMPPDVAVAIFGEGPLREDLAALAARLGLGERVRFQGWSDELADYVAAADVFCLSSAWEGIPLAAQEAILLGTPVVATDVGGMRELVEDRSSGRLVGPGCPAELARAVVETLRAPERAAAYAAAARRHLLEHFSADRMLDRLGEVYDAAHLA